MPIAHIYAVSDTGLVRQANEDKILVRSVSEQSPVEEVSGQPIPLHGLLAIVADGMGGAVGGEFASDLAVKTMYDYVQKHISNELSVHQIVEVLKQAIVQAHLAILNETRRQPDLAGMGTTAVIGYFTSNYLLCAWVGDSRLYRYMTSPRDSVPYFIPANATDQLYQITHDHSIVWEQVKLGQISPEEARLSSMSNLITQSVGDPLQTPKPDTSILPLLPDDTFLFCSDGLSGMISDQVLADTIRENGTDDLERLGEELILLAKQEGGRDNISLILVKPEKVDPSLSSLSQNKLSTTQKSIASIRKKNRSKKTSLIVGTILLLLGVFGLFVWNWNSKPESHETSTSLTAPEDSSATIPTDTSLTPAIPNENHAADSNNVPVSAKDTSQK